MLRDASRSHSSRLGDNSNIIDQALSYSLEEEEEEEDGIHNRRIRTHSEISSDDGGGSGTGEGGSGTSADNRERNLQHLNSESSIGDGKNSV